MLDKRKVVIDCDPGIDDAVALIMSFKRLKVVGVTTVGGNVGLKNTLNNALFITELTGNSDIPVFAGCDMPLFSKPERAEDVHGASGLGNLDNIKPAKKAEDKHSVDYIIDTFMKEDDISLITLGPLTNIAMALLKEPELKKKIPEILCMGGSVTAGNHSAVSEFNIYVDPEAAKVVFESGIPIKMVGLNLCRQNNMTEDDVAEIKKIGNKVSDLVANILDFSTTALEKTELCDALAVSWYINEDIMKYTLPMSVKIETKGEYTRGMTVCDYRNYIGDLPPVDIERWKTLNYKTDKENCEVAMEIDIPLFKKILIEILKEY